MHYAPLAAALILLMLACAPRHAPRGTLIEWLVGHEAPDFDPDGPPEALRWALERHLSRGLVDEDSSGRIVPAAAESIAVSSDGLTVRFHLRPGLAFTDGRPCASPDFRAALETGLARRDHGTRAALLGAVRGVEAVRAGRPLPPLGIETPDARSLVLRLARPDSLLLRKLALPGVSTPWRDRAPGDWKAACGLGPYRVAKWEPDRRLTMVRSSAHGRTDTLLVRFVPNAARARNLMRNRRTDLVWPLPLLLLDQTLPAGFVTVRSPARPDRQLLLVMRADVPPTTRLPARRALAHALNRSDVMAALGALADPAAALIQGAPAFEPPKFDAAEVSAWLARGDLGRSFHVAMAFDENGTSAVAARALQGSWSRLNLYVELRALRASAFAVEALQGHAQLLLVEHQPALDRPESQLAELVMPLRGPACGPFRTGWRTREFDAWLAGRVAAASSQPAAAQRRFEEELIVLPIARLPWVRVLPHAGLEVPFHPHFGPDFAGSAPLSGPSGPRRGFLR